MMRPWKLAWLLLFVCAHGFARAQTVQTGKTDERPIGLPSKIDRTFNVDAAWDSFAYGMVYLAYAY